MCVKKYEKVLVEVKGCSASEWVGGLCWRERIEGS